MISDQSKNDSEHHDFEVLDGLRLSEPDAVFKEVKSGEIQCSRQ